VEHHESPISTASEAVRDPAAGHGACLRTRFISYSGAVRNLALQDSSRRAGRWLLRAIPPKILNYGSSSLGMLLTADRPIAIVIDLDMFGPPNKGNRKVGSEAEADCGTQALGP